jgi:hypothetical protein
MIQSSISNSKDLESEGYLANLAADEKLRAAEKVPQVKTVVVLLSTRSMAYDRSALTQKIQLTYPESKVFFMTTFGLAVGPTAPEQIDLLIDFTGPGQKHKRMLARSLRSRTRVAVGRDAGFFRLFIYDRVVSESKETLPDDLLARESIVQRMVLRLAGIPLSQKGELLVDLAKDIQAVNVAAKRH